MTTPPPLPDPAYRTNFGSGLRAYSTEQMHDYAAQQVAAERERIKARLLGMDDAISHHNYYAHAAWVLFERAQRWN